VGNSERPGNRVGQSETEIKTRRGDNDGWSRDAGQADLRTSGSCSQTATVAARRH
jgi:hypothetical protein